jgi:hypothetical protein
MKLKTICYRGGIARFSIPDSWVEECEPSGGGMFFEDAEGSGTLRLNVMSFASKGNEAADEMIASLIRDQGYDRLGTARAIRHFQKSAVEIGAALAIYYWQIAVPVPPNAIRLAIFSYTILESQASHDFFQREIALLDKSIRTGEYSSEAGVSGDCAPD